MSTHMSRYPIIAGAAYVAGWIAGLLVAPSGPAATAGADAVRDFYAGHGPAILVQSVLVHGIPAAALVGLAIAAARRADAALRRWVTASGLTAAALSLGQVGIAVVAVATAHTARAATTAGLFHALNLADTAKLLAIAGFAVASWAAARRRGVAPGWFTALTAVLVVLLPAGGAAFLAANAVLSALLIASLPVLLAWVAALTVVVVRDTGHGSDSVAEPARHIDVAGIV